MNKILVALALVVVMSGNVNAHLPIRTAQRITTCQFVENAMESLLKNYSIGKKAERKSALEDIKLLSEIFDNYCKD